MMKSLSASGFRLRPIFGLALLVIWPFTFFAQQSADPNFDARVARPAYTAKHPKVLFDEAHYNFHTSTERYKPFADLITNDGYRVTPNKEKFSAATLKGYDVLVIANALGAATQRDAAAANPAFTEAECEAVRKYVEAGGALLLIADHMPFGAAAEILANKFGVVLGKGTTIDEANYDTEAGNRSFLVFTREQNLLADHPILQGRSEAERINRVETFTGQSLKGPAGSVVLLKLSSTAMDREPPASDTPPVQLDKLPNGQPLPEGVIVMGRRAGPPKPAVGNAQGIALPVGKGRVVVLGEAGMLSAQLVEGIAAQMSGKEKIVMGMNRAGIDNRQFALNLMHWLSRLLK